MNRRKRLFDLRQPSKTNKILQGVHIAPCRTTVACPRCAVRFFLGTGPPNRGPADG